MNPEAADGAEPTSPQLQRRRRWLKRGFWAFAALIALWLLAAYVILPADVAAL